MTRSALVIGGTGPTGPHILRGLLDRGFDVTIFHRGSHEPPDLPEVRHIHGDPHSAESIEESVGGGEYDVVLAAYGRVRLLAESFAGRCGHFVAISGTSRYAGFVEPSRLTPSGPLMPLSEDAPTALDLPPDGSPALEFAQRVVRTERAVLSSQPEATYVVYPIVYGPRTVWPWEWSVVKRVLDKRRTVLIPDEGMALHSRAAVRNAAEVPLRAIDHPELARGRYFNAGDDAQLSVRQWVELLVERLETSVELVSVPSAVAPWVRAMYVPSVGAVSDHAVLDTARARTELGYRDAVDVRSAVDELIAWFAEHPVDAATTPALRDRFDYDTEDALAARWTRMSAELRGEFGADVAAEAHR